MTAQPRRSWFRFAFSLRTLFVVVTIIGVWLGWNLKIVRERKALIQELRRASSRRHPFYSLAGDLEQDSLKQSSALSIFRRALGDKAYELLEIPYAMKRDRIKQFDAAFPEAELWVEVGGGIEKVRAARTNN